MEALDSLANSTNFVMQSIAVKMALNDSFWAIKKQGLDYFGKADPRTRSVLESQLIQLATSDKKSDVRTGAIYCLSTYFDQDENVPSREHANLYTKLVKDLSYNTSAEALRALQIVEPTIAYTMAKLELPTAKKELKEAVILAIAENGNAADSDFIHSEFNKSSGFEVVGMTYNLISFLENQNSSINASTLKEIEYKIISLDVWYQRYYTLKMLKEYTSENVEFNAIITQLYQSLVSVEKHERVLTYLGVK